jgi:serpin B
VIVFILTILLLVPIAGCDSFLSGDNDDPQPQFERRELPRELTVEEKQIVDGGGHFGFNLLHKLLEQAPQESHFISPFSILMAFGMTMNGAEADTYTQMQEVFGLQDMSREEINRAARELIDLLTGFDDKVVFNIANSIWYRDTFSVEQDFLDTNQHYFDAAIEAADFDDPETVDRINQWVSDNTEGLIEEIVEGPIDPLTVMYLINAIYFNGEWTIQFDPDDTDRKPFHRPDGTTVEVDMMRISEVENMQYTSGEDYQAVNLYYGDAGYAMTLVLPDEETGLDNWLQNKTWNDWRELTGSFSSVTLNLEMPKFELEYEVDGFGDILQDLGIIDAFDYTISDFSRINPAQDDLYISDTRHVTFIRVDEEGTEAAAVTSVEVSVTSGPLQVEITFDRPFFYVIREVESITILFMGTMTDPS